MYDRSLVDYSRYNKSIGHAGVKYSMAVQATRGCPYRCFYCDVYKTTLHHFRRSVDSIFEEVKQIADLGIKRIEFVDDIFNVKKKDFHFEAYTNNPKFLAKQKENTETDNNERKKFNFKKGKKRFKNRNRPKSFKFKKHSRRGRNRAF